MSELCDKSARELQALIGSGDVSPVEVLESCIGRIEQTNPTLNAVVATCYDRAREEAKAAEKRVRAGEDLPPLHGLPVGIKDLNETEGLRTTHGSVLYADHVPAADEALVARLRDAGAIIVGKTNTPEFGAGAHTDNRVYGATLNPFDLARTPGGSSGGSAVALAAGMLPLCHGSDTGGSLRNPATWCGVVGFRPTPGLVPRETRSVGFSHFSTQGPMARDVRVAALFMAGLAGDDGRDPLAHPVDASAFRAPPAVDLGGLRVGWSVDLGVAPVDDIIRDAFMNAVGAVAGAFKTCTQVTPDFSDARDVFWVLRCVYYLANHAERYERHRDMLAPNVVANVEAGLKMTLADVGAAEKGWARIYRDFQTVFREVDLLLVPGDARSPFKAADGPPKVVGGRKMDNYMDASLVRSALTLTGHPVVALPAGRDADAMPFGIQVVGPRRGDSFLLGAAAALEDHLATVPGLERPIPDIEDYRT